VGLVAYNWSWKTKTETPATETALVTAVEKVKESFGATQKAHTDLEKIALTVSKENLELRKEIETLKKKLGKFDRVQKVLDELNTGE
jgi:regulator of replication initiation timing